MDAPAPTKPGRTRRALALAAALVLAVNAWVGYRLPALLRETEADYPFELARRVAAFPRPEAVRVLLLGNSHVLAGPRPPDLAAALGAGPDAVFSLALPGLTAVGAIALFQRHRAAFPALRALVIGVDEPFLDWDEEPKNRQLTAGSVAARWRYAGRQPAAADRIGLLAAAWFPLVDLKGQLDAAHAAAPGRFWRRLAGAEPPEADGHAVRMHASPWRWGLPPPWDHYPPDVLARIRADGNAAVSVVLRGESFFPPAAARTRARNLADLGDLVAQARAAGLGVWLLRPPYAARLRGRLKGAAASAYEADLAAFVAARGLAWAPVPAALSAAAYFDPDHLAPAGSRLLARSLAGDAGLRRAGRD